MMDELLLKGQQVLRVEAEALLAASQRLNNNFSSAAKLLAEHRGKIILTGMGKSGHIAKKIASTLSSVGSSSVFLHPADAVHGDLGVYALGDPTILLSKSGATRELQCLLPILRDFHSPLIGVLGNVNSVLGRAVDIALDASVKQEADPLNLTPTTSAAVALAIGDALAVAIMSIRNFQPKDFARLHPGGQLGRNLCHRVRDVMHNIQYVACVSTKTNLKDVVITMTHFPLGIACVLDDRRCLLGIITDGDVRRTLQNDHDIRLVKAGQIMSCMPQVIFPDDSLAVALEKMEKRASQISVLPVVDEDHRCLGVLRIHDIYRADG